MSTEHTPTPWDLTPSTEHHGPYITSDWGSTICDFYAMSNPSSLSVRNGGDSVPIHFVDADANAAFATRAVNAHDDLVAALNEVMDWIGNWDPNFIHDDEWPETSRRAHAALARAEGRS